MPQQFPERQSPKPIITTKDLRQIVDEQIAEKGLEGVAKVVESQTGVVVSIGPTTTSFTYDALTFQGNRADQFPSWVGTKLDWLIAKRARLDRAANTVTAVLKGDDAPAVKNSFKPKPARRGRPRKPKAEAVTPEANA